MQSIHRSYSAFDLQNSGRSARLHQGWPIPDMGPKMIVVMVENIGHNGEIGKPFQPSAYEPQQDCPLW